MPTRARVDREWSFLDAPHFPRNSAADSALADVDGLLAEPLRILTANDGERCKSHDITQSLLASIQDKLAKISAHVKACESKGRFGVEQLLVGPKYIKPVVLTLHTISATLAEYTALFPAYQVVDKAYINSHMPILREGTPHFKLRHLLSWLRESGRSDITQGELKSVLENAGYNTKLFNLRVTDSQRTIAAWYWRKIA